MKKEINCPKGLKKAVKPWGRLLFPSRCPGCDRILAEADVKRGFCRACALEIEIAKPVICMKCGKVISDAAEEYCSDCRKNRHYYDIGRGVFVYSGPMKKAMYRFKYDNRRCYADVFSEYAERVHGDFLLNQDFDAVIPVPMYRWKERARGYNQAACFAKAIAEKINAPLLTDLVLRTKPTVPMKGLSAAERKANLKNAFKIKQSDVLLRRVLVIDDIYTTGTTVDAVAKLLKANGVLSVCCLYICVGKGD